MRAWDLGQPAIEHRIFGLDRRLILPTLAVVAITLLLGKGLPFIDSMIPADEYDGNSVQAVHDLIEFIPAAGWIPDGVPAPSNPALTIFHEGASFTVAPGSWEGTVDELLDSILSTSREYQTKGDRRSFELPSGLQGVALHLFGIGEDGALFALVAPDSSGIGADDRGVGIRVVVRGPAELLPEFAPDVAGMLRSFRLIENADEGEDK